MFAGCQDTLTAPATNKPTSWQKQHHHSRSLKGLDQRWPTYEGSRDKNRKKHSKHGGPPRPLTSTGTRDSTSRRPQAARRSYRSRVQLCTICWQRDPSTGTSPHITRDSTMPTHA
jgi:hypothetical protein